LTGDFTLPDNHGLQPHCNREEVTCSVFVDPRLRKARDRKVLA
jgi:hypothetical protein